MHIINGSCVLKLLYNLQQNHKYFRIKRFLWIHLLSSHELPKHKFLLIIWSVFDLNFNSSLPLTNK